LTAFRGRLLALSCLMTAQRCDALNDLPPTPPGELFSRFNSWVRAAQFANRRGQAPGR
jgi:hypothetical protein